MFRIAACLALVLPTTCLAQVAFFPSEPGPTDPIYLLYSDACTTAPPIGRPTLTRINSTGGWRFDLKHNHNDYVCDLPISGGNTYAFEIPRKIGGYDVGTVQVVEQLVIPHSNAVETYERSLSRPRGPSFPASVSGTWTLDGAAYQGLLISMDPARRLAIGFATFDVAGKPAWLTGIASPQASRITVPLLEVVDGKFAGTRAEAAPPRSWGELDLTYSGCGRLDALWRPLASTALASGSGTFRQLTSAFAYECDLAAYGLRNDRKIILADYGIIE